MKLFKKLKAKYNNYINNLAKINEKEFGGKGLDCCGLNNQNDKKNNK